MKIAILPEQNGWLNIENVTSPCLPDGCFIFTEHTTYQEMIDNVPRDVVMDILDTAYNNPHTLKP